jgi:phosphatidylcholine synthase
MGQGKQYHFVDYVRAWGVHLFTASAAFLGVMTLVEITQQEYIHAIWLMVITIVIDALDGAMARGVHVKSVLPRFDGALLDNIVDFLNYVVTPSFFLLFKPDMLPVDASVWIVLAITMTSAYQFCQSDAKTPDHFFKGFPCYWNIVVSYMFLFDTSMTFNTVVLSILCVLIFVPIKYVYPSRLDYLTDSKKLKILMHVFSFSYGVSSVMMLWYYPVIHRASLIFSIVYIIVYLWLSLYRTYYPMIKAKLELRTQK